MRLPFSNQLMKYFVGNEELEIVLPKAVVFR